MLKKIDFFQHQQQALTETEGRNKVAYYLDMGLGKTFVGAEKAMNFGIDILIVCQKSKIRDWVNHFFTYYIDKMKCDENGAWCYDLTKNLDSVLHGWQDDEKPGAASHTKTLGLARPRVHPYNKRPQPGTRRLSALGN